MYWFSVLPIFNSFLDLSFYKFKESGLIQASFFSWQCLEKNLKQSYLEPTCLSIEKEDQSLINHISNLIY